MIAVLAPRTESQKTEKKKAETVDLDE